MSALSVSLLTVSSGSSLTLSTFECSGFPRLFESIDGLYVYKISASLLRSDTGLAWTEIGNGGLVQAMAGDYSGTPDRTVVIEPTAIYYQNVPENSAGWTSGSASLPSAFVASDAVSDANSVIGILAGNQHVGTEWRVAHSAQAAPYQFTQSDTGITLTPTQPIMTDLEIAE